MFTGLHPVFSGGEEMRAQKQKRRNMEQTDPLPYPVHIPLPRRFCPAAAQKQGNWIPCPKPHLPTQSVLVTLWTLPFSCLSPSFSYLISSRKTDKPPSPPLPSGLCCLPSHAQRHKVLRHKSIFPSSDAHRYGSTLLNPAISHPNPFFWRCGITAPGWPQL